MKPIGPAVSFVLLVASTAVQAQASGREQADRRGDDCVHATQVVVTGQPAPQMDWATRVLPWCGPEGEGAALARGVRRLRTSADTVALEQLWGASRYLTDRRLFEAALDIAGDPAASTEARVFAILALRRTIIFGTSAEYENMVGGFYETLGLVGVRGGCTRGIFSDDLG